MGSRNTQYPAYFNFWTILKPFEVWRRDLSCYLSIISWLYKWGEVGGGRWTKIIMLNYFWLSLVIWSWAFNLYLMSCWESEGGGLEFRIAPVTDRVRLISSLGRRQGEDPTNILTQTSQYPSPWRNYIYLQFWIKFSHDNSLVFPSVACTMVEKCRYLSFQCIDLSSNSKF